MRRNMDIIAIVLLIVAALIILAVAGWLIYREISNHRMMLYERKLAAESKYDATIMSAAKSFVVGKFLYITRGVNRDGIILYDVQMLPNTSSEMPVAATAIPIDASTHRLAVEWVMMSIGQSPKDTQLLPESKVRAAGLITDPNRWVEVGNYLSEKYGVVKINDRGGDKNGTYTKAGTTLKDLLRDLAVAALAPTPPRETAGVKSA